MSIEYLLLIIFILLNVADIASTLLAIKIGLIELNPVFVYLFKKIGMLPSLIIVKIILVAAFYVAVEQSVEDISVYLMIVIGIYVAVLVNNVLHIIRQKKLISSGTVNR